MHVWYYLCSGRLTNSPHHMAVECPPLQPSGGSFSIASKQAGGPGSHPGVWRLELMTHKGLAWFAGYSAKAVQLAARVGRFRCPLR